MSLYNALLTTVRQVLPRRAQHTVIDAQRTARTGHLAGLGLITILVAVVGCELWAGSVSHAAFAVVQSATRVNAAYQQTRHAVDLEIDLQDAYYHEAGPTTRAQFWQASRLLADSLALAVRESQAVPDTRDEARVATNILAANRRYTAAFGSYAAAVDAGDFRRARDLDQAIDPLFAAIQVAVDSASTDEQENVLQAIRATGTGQDRVALITFLVSVLGLGLVGLFLAAQQMSQHREVTQMKAAALTVSHSEERFRALVQRSSDMTAVVDPTGRITYVSPAITTLLGYDPVTLLGQNAWEIVHPHDAALLSQRTQISRLSPQAGMEVRVRHQDGSWRVVEAISTDLRADPAVAGIVLNARDVTERKLFEDQLRHQAFHDALTGLPNRALFQDRLEYALTGTARNARPTAVLLLDLDDFKIVNDSLGHAAGDTLLTAVATRLTQCLREEDTIARLGGDEFAVLLGEMSDVDDTTRAAQRILDALDTAFAVEGQAITSTASIGIAIGTPGTTGADLLRDADVALYRAKATGRRCYQVFDAMTHARALERLQLENELRLALHREEFEVYYQPKVDLVNGTCVGLEALVRWCSPQRGLVLPGIFIPLAEETGLICPIGQWVLEEACRQTKRWNDGGSGVPHVVVSVNLSGRQFAQPTLVEDIARALADSRVDPQDIQLEITESVAMGNAEATVATLHKLRSLGVQLAIDDFGTGYSSLAYLRRFPLDVLKIDRTFVTGLGNGREDDSIVRAVIGLGQALGLCMVAEGIETREQLAQLSTMGCELGQGFYFARPLPLDQVEVFIGRAQSSVA